METKPAYSSSSSCSSTERRPEVPGIAFVQPGLSYSSTQSGRNADLPRNKKHTQFPNCPGPEEFKRWASWNMHENSPSRNRDSKNKPAGLLESSKQSLRKPFWTSCRKAAFQGSGSCSTALGRLMIACVGFSTWAPFSSSKFA